MDREILSFEDKMPFLFTHLKHPRMPRTTNLIERIIHQLSLKIDDTNGFISRVIGGNRFIIRQRTGE